LFYIQLFSLTMAAKVFRFSAGSQNNGFQPRGDHSE
jgi:hypothetical protein